MKVAICSPIYDSAKAGFARSLFALTNWTARQQVQYNGTPTAPELLWATSEGDSNIGNAREEIAEAALAQGVDYLLWLDADQTFPPDTILRLAAHDLPVVGANYMRRKARASVAGNLADGRIIPIAARPDGVEAVDVIGFGVLLMKAEVLRTLSRPWFEMSKHGEDGYFCAKAKAHGIQPYVDHSLSMEVGHIAETVLTFPR